MKGWLAIAMAGWAVATGAFAEPADGELGPVTVVATGISNMTAASAGDVSHADLSAVPLLRPAAILENIPGLIVTQHSGEGKANQYFLRAFNLDHGTDLALEVDDMPVNLPSHAHGQGYADLNFLIPELAADLHYKKGPYFADEGDFATAGTARIDLANEMPASVTAGAGEDGYRRLLVAGSTRLGDGSLLGAVELYDNDGPFQVPDTYRRRSGILRYHAGDPLDFTTVTAMSYAGRWHSTDQVPLRAIDEGLIGRFGSLDPTDGGDTRRDSLSVTRVRRSDTGLVQFSAYVIRYRLDLWSMFTYLLADPGHGDQMLQHDDRIVYGFKTSKTWYASLAGRPLTSVIGIQTRLDDIGDVGISPTDARQVIGVRQDARVRETMGAIYAESRVEWTDKVSTTLGLREDAFSFAVRDRLVDGAGRCTLASDPLGCNTGSVRASIASPKFGLALGPWAHSTFFLTAGDGYHSNDARGVTRDTQSPGGAPVTPLTRATSAEVGVVSRPVAGWETHVDVFRLRLKSELVFDGDAGATSPSGATTRTGIEWGNRYVVNDWLAATVNAAVTKARFDSPAPPDDLGCGSADRGHPCAQLPAIVGRYVPNSPTSVIDAAVTAGRETGWFGAIRARHVGESPLVEDGSARSPAYTTLDLQLGFRGTDRWLVAMDIFNVTNTRWNDIEYYYASRLKGESVARPDFVVHPGVPRTLRLSLQYRLAP